jgi:hypothetical protein
MKVSLPVRFNPLKLATGMNRAMSAPLPRGVKVSGALGLRTKASWVDQTTVELVTRFLQVQREGEVEAGANGGVGRVGEIERNAIAFDEKVGAEGAGDCGVRQVVADGNGVPPIRTRYRHIGVVSKDQGGRVQRGTEAPARAKRTNMALRM